MPRHMCSPAFAGERSIRGVYAYDTHIEHIRERLRHLRHLQEEGGYEEAAYHHGESGTEEARIEPALLVQPLGNEAGESEAGSTLGSVVPLCVAGSEGPCARSVRGGEGTCKSCRRQHR